LIKPFGKKLWYLFTVSVIMNFGWLYERIVIIIDSLHRDYIPSSWAMYYPTIFGGIILQGVIVGIIALFIGHLIANKKAKELSSLRL